MSVVDETHQALIRTFRSSSPLRFLPWIAAGMTTGPVSVVLVLLNMQKLGVLIVPKK